MTCSTVGCERGEDPSGATTKCCITCGNSSFPDVHLAWCERRNGTHHTQVEDRVLCRYCGQEIALDEHGVWHHASDDAVVCAIGLDTEEPGEIAIQNAAPVDGYTLRRRDR